MNFLN